MAGVGLIVKSWVVGSNEMKSTDDRGVSVAEGLTKMISSIAAYEPDVSQPGPSSEKQNSSS